MEYPIQAILILLTLSVITVALFRRIHFPPMLGYLCVGLLVGPSVFKVLQQNTQAQTLADYGVVFLMFTVGLELSLAQLRAMKTTVLGFGGSQVLLCTLTGGAITLALGYQFIDALIIGGVVAMSSTAIVSKQLIEQLEFNSRHGRNAMGILIFQDLAVIPFLILLPFYKRGLTVTALMELSVAFLKGLLVFTFLVAFGRWFLRPLFRVIASAQSTELFMLTVLLLAMAAASATNLAVQSTALGAFIAGIMLGETEFRHQIEANIRPFRDILLGFFFITIGMLLNLDVIFAHWAILVLIVSALISIKILIIVGLGVLFRHEAGVALRTGLVLGQGGEFGFAIISLALHDKLLEATLGQVLLAAIIISMAIAPFIIRYNGVITKHLFTRSYLAKRQQYQTDLTDITRDLDQHVVICGYGRVGQNIGRFLDAENIPYIALDVDPYVIQEANEAGDRVMYGDSTHHDILVAAHLNNARVLVISFEDINATYKIMAHARQIHPNIPVLVRTSDDSHLEDLIRIGATEVVPEKLEASLVLVSHLLLLLGIKPDTIDERIRNVRAEQYLLLRSYFQNVSADALEADASKRKRLHSVALAKDAAAVGKTLKQLELDKLGVLVTSIKREQGKSAKPSPDIVLCEEDVLVLFGKPGDLEHAESFLLQGR